MSEAILTVFLAQWQRDDKFNQGNVMDYGGSCVVFVDNNIFFVNVHGELVALVAVDNSGTKSQFDVAFKFLSAERILICIANVLLVRVRTLSPFLANAMGCCDDPIVVNHRSTTCASTVNVHLPRDLGDGFYFLSSHDLTLKHRGFNHTCISCDDLHEFNGMRKFFSISISILNFCTSN
jgi:hypothetical protein